MKRNIIPRIYWKIIGVWEEEIIIEAPTKEAAVEIFLEQFYPREERRPRWSTRPPSRYDKVDHWDFDAVYKSRIWDAWSVYPI